MATSKIALTIRIESDLIDKMQYIAKKELRSVNNLYEFYIAKAIETYEKENGKIDLYPENVNTNPTKIIEDYNK